MINNRENNIWTVYVHIVPKTITEYDYDKYYVGITKQSVNERWKNGSGYSGQLFHRAIQKYGWNNIEHYVIAEHLTEYEAKEFEKVLIKTLGSNVHKENFGYNITDGGDGMTGYIMSEESKKKIGIKNKGKWLGKKHTKESLLKMSISQKFAYKYNHKKKIHSKKIYQFDINGNYINSYNSMIDALRTLKINVQITHLSRYTKLHKQVYGYLWGFESDIIMVDGVPKLNYIYKESKRKPSPMSKHVYQFNIKGDFIKDYISFNEASKAVNVDKSNISRAARYNKKYKTSGGFIWRLEENIDFDENNKPILKGDDKTCV